MLRGDGRAAGVYEQFSDSPSIVEWFRFFAPGSRSARACTGLLDNPGTVGPSSLVDLAHVHFDGELCVDIVDLLAAVGLRREAEVAVFVDKCGDEVAVPVRAMLGGAWLVLDVIGARLSAPLTATVSLSLPGWTDPEVPFHPIEMRVVSFSEFVQCQ